MATAIINWNETFLRPLHWYLPRKIRSQEKGHSAITWSRTSLSLHKPFHTTGLILYQRYIQVVYWYIQRYTTCKIEFSAVNYFRKKLLFRCSTGFWISPCIPPLKISESIRFPDVSRGYGKRPVAWNGLNKLNPFSSNPTNGHTHSNNSLAFPDELFECVWPFLGVGA